MGRKNKLKKFSDLMSYPNVYENKDPKNPCLLKGDEKKIDLKGLWSSNHFSNNQSIILELACGRGEYTLGLAKAYPGKNFIGVDVKGARIWQGATTALRENIYNAAFLRTRIEQINLFFSPKEVEEIWITFPDPFLRESKENKRLTSGPFLDRYQQIIVKGGLFHLKTDDKTLYLFTLDTLRSYPGAKILYQNDDIYADPLIYSELEYKTYYEKSHLQNDRTIKYIRFTIN